MKLQKLILRNFKGCQFLELNFDGKNADIFGTNEAGKTTTVDAWTWLLFDKDSQNKKDFGIKTKNLHNVEHSVEAVCSLTCGKTLNLKKIYKEKWTKKRGTTQRIFTGHTTDYYIDDLPVKKKEFSSKIEELFGGEETFRLISDPYHFNVNMKWQDRRDLLISISGDVNESDILEAPQFAELKEALGDNDIQKFIDSVKKKKSLLQKDLDSIPTRIDEVRRGIDGISDIDTARVDQKLKEIDTEISTIDSKIVDLENGAFISGVKKQIAEVETERINAKNEHTQKYSNIDNPLEKEMSAIKRDIRNKGDIVADFKSRKNQLETKMKFNVDERDRIRADYNKAKDAAFLGSDTCSTCGQNLPAEKIEEALQNFNKAKSDRMQESRGVGLKLKSEYDGFSADLETVERQLRNTEDYIVELKKNLEMKEGAVESVKIPVFDSSSYETKIKELNNSIQDAKNASTEEIEKLKAEKAEKEESKKEYLEINAQANERKRGLERIIELENEESKISGAWHAAEKMHGLCEDFMRDKIDLVEGELDKHFEDVKFKMFENQINEGLKECCEVTFKGIPYTDLNGAGKIQAGLHIINTLCKHYGQNAPVFIDNAESIVDIPKTEGQQIRLTVSENDKTLRLEV